MAQQADQIAASVIAALQGIAVERVPPPALCSQVNDLPYFFKIFERYATFMYKSDKQSWLQILPNYVEGEVLQIVNAFGNNYSYDEIKDRILSEFIKPHKVSGQSYIDLLTLKKRPNENLRCFLIRLESLTALIETNPNGRRAIILSALRNNISSEVLFHVDLQLCSHPSFTISDFIERSEAVSETLLKQKSCVQAAESVQVGEVLGDSFLPSGQSGITSNVSQINGSSCRSDSAGSSCNGCVEHLLCGERSHFTGDCEGTKGMLPGKGKTKQQSPLLCGFCGQVGHAMIQCDKFLEFQSKLFSVDISGDSNEVHDVCNVRGFDECSDYAVKLDNCTSKFAGGYCLILNLGNLKLAALLDTGATVSIIDTKILKKIPQLQNQLKPKRVSAINGLGGSPVSVLGEIDCHFELGSKDNGISLEPHTLHAVDAHLSVPVILGVDFLQKNKIIIDTSANRILMRNSKNKLVELPTNIRMYGSSCNIYNCHTEILQPGECKLVRVKLDGNITEQGCIVPTDAGKIMSWRLAGSVNSTQDGVTFGEFVNFSNEPVYLNKGIKVGKWQPICYVASAGDECADVEELFELLKIDELSLEEGQRNALKELITTYKDVFSNNDEELGYCDTILHSIDVGDSPPVRQRYRRLHPPIRDEVNKELSKMERQGLIEKSTSPWCSPLVPVKKKNGKIRICIDYRKLNSVTKMNSYPLPNIEDNLAQFAGSKYFSTLDLLSGYHQVALSEDSKEKTAFATENGLYQFRVMPQGACGSPATFQNLMHIVLRGIPSDRALAYLDDVLVVGTSFSDHLHNLGDVLCRLRAHGLKLSINKCNLLKTEVPYLGHVLSCNGIRPSPHNVEALLKIPVPRTLKQVKRLCGMVNYYGKFVENLANIMSPIYKLLSNKKVIWTEECQDAFEHVKKKLCSYPVLSFPRYGTDDTFILTTDASEKGVGAVLSQVQGGEERCLGYGSCSFSKAQYKYTATEKELAAIRFGVKHFKPYLFGRKFIIRVDHQALTYLEQMKSVDNRLLRTYEDIQVGEYHIEYLKGSNNVIADTLSRNPLSEELSECDMQNFDRPELCPKYIAEGGPNSLFDSICWALTNSVITPEELREDVVNFLLDNLTKYGFTNKGKDPKYVSSLKNCNIFANQKLLKPFVDKYRCNIILHYNPGPTVEFISDNPHSEIELECRGGIHYNGISEEKMLDVPDEDILDAQVNVLATHQSLDDELCENSAVNGLLGNHTGNISTDEGEEVISNSIDLWELSPDDLLPDAFRTESCPIDKVGDQVRILNREEPATGEKDTNSCVLPSITKDEAMEIIRDIHVELGHPGRDLTLKTCKRRFRTSNMWKLVMQCVRNCDTCQRYKEPVKRRDHQEPWFPLGSSAPGEVLAIDLMDMSGRTKRGNCCLLVAVDMFSRFGYAIPLRNKKSKTVAEALERNILASSIIVPSTVLSDNGPEFRGEPIRLLLEKYGIEHTKSIPYHPQSNGVVERLNRTLKTRLATAVDGNYDSWDQMIHRVILQYNHSVHGETKCTPASFYGSSADDVALPAKFQFTRPPGRNFKPYELDDLVLRKIPFHGPQSKHKLAPRYDGPYHVKEVLSPVTYRIKHAYNNTRLIIVHVSQLKPYHGQIKKGRVFKRSKHTNPAPRIPVPVNISSKPEAYSETYGFSENLIALRNGYKTNNDQTDFDQGSSEIPPRIASTPEHSDPPVLHMDSGDLIGESPPQISLRDFHGFAASGSPDNHEEGHEYVSEQASGNLETAPQPNRGSSPVQNITANQEEIIQEDVLSNFSGFTEPPVKSRQLYNDIQGLLGNCRVLAQQKNTGPITRARAKQLASISDDVPRDMQLNSGSLETREKEFTGNLRRIVEECEEKIIELLEISESSGELRDIVHHSMEALITAVSSCSGGSSDESEMQVNLGGTQQNLSLTSMSSNSSIGQSDSKEMKCGELLHDEKLSCSDHVVGGSDEDHKRMMPAVDSSGIQPFCVAENEEDYLEEVHQNTGSRREKNCCPLS